MPEGSVLDAWLFKIFLNDLVLFIKEVSLHNYADDNTLSAYSSDLKPVVDALIEKSQTDTIVNPKTSVNNVCLKDKKHDTSGF